MPEHPNQLTTTNLAAWQTYATEALTTETGPARPPTRLDWCQIPGIGPGAEILGDITGLRVLELGCGTGNTSAYLAAAGAPVTGVDSAAAQIQRARLRWQHPNLDFVHAEASDHLQRPGPRFDAIVSVFGPSTGPHPPNSCR
ncbi:MAG: methyltransferase type 11 [Actinomycetia bacterium]|nr:methyltransferase type 11 [Actinomycetes bacterium]